MGRHSFTPPADGDMTNHTHSIQNIKVENKQLKARERYLKKAFPGCLFNSLKKDLNYVGIVWNCIATSHQLKWENV